MEVLLITTVEKLGEPGDVVVVADGYARNYLLPKGLAVEPTPHNMERYRKLKERRMKELQSRKEKSLGLRERLNELVLTFEREAHEGKLYGSVRREDIAAKILEEVGEEIEKDRIELDESIEKLGKYTARINLYEDISAVVRIRVESTKRGEEDG
jgi:large subunit ribosomal protein L9